MQWNSADIILLKNTYNVLEFTWAGERTTTFDKYSNWMEGRTFGKEAMDKIYDRPEKTEARSALTEEDKKTIEKNVVQNVISFAEEKPNIELYLFFTWNFEETA